MGQPICQMGLIDGKVCYIICNYFMTLIHTAQKIKQNLIRNAKIKKSYTKVKKLELSKNPEAFNSAYLTEVPEPHSQELHPERQAMLNEPEVPVEQSSISKSKNGRRRQRHKVIPFQKEVQLAQQRKEDADGRRKAIEQSQQQRQEKIEEREKFRKAMAKARVGGKNGQRKLGRESKVLLEKVKRVVSE